MEWVMWALIRNDTIRVLEKTENAAWTFGLNWPTPEEIREHQAQGWRVEQVIIKPLAAKEDAR